MAGEDGCSITDLPGGKERSCFDSFIYLKHLTGCACRHTYARGQCDMSDLSREFPWMDGDELGCPPLILWWNANKCRRNR